MTYRKWWAPLTYALAFLVPLGILHLLLGIDANRLNVPINQLDTDMAVQAMFVKPAIDGSDSRDVARLGAPFRQDLFMHPVNSTVAFGFAQTFGMLTKNLGYAMNLGWFFKLMWTGLVAAWAFRQLGLSLPVSLAFSVIYTFMPFTFFHHIYHYNLVIDGLPVALLIALTSCEGRFKNLPLRTRVISLVYCGVIGFSDPYQAVFCCFLLAYGVWSVVIAWRPRDLLPLLASLAIIGAAGFLNAQAGIQAMRANPQSIALFEKSRAPKETLPRSLHIAELFLPVPGHPWKAWNSVGQTYRTEFDDRAMWYHNEIGTLAALGLTVLLLAFPAVFWRKQSESPEKSFSESLMYPCGMAIFLVLLAPPWGLNSLVNLYLFRYVRTYDRVSALLALLGLLTLAMALDGWVVQRCLRRGRIWLSAPVIAGLAGLAAFAVWDQKGLCVTSSTWDNACVLQERRLAVLTKVESRLLPGAMVYQAVRDPWTNWSELLYPYLLTKKTRWSLGYSDAQMRWHQWLQAQGDNMAPALLLSGFDGVWYDPGQNDRSIPMDTLLAIPGAKLVTEDASVKSGYAFVDLHQVRDRVSSTLGSTAYKEAERAALNSEDISETLEQVSKIIRKPL